MSCYVFLCEREVTSTEAVSVDNRKELLSRLPSVDSVLEQDDIKGLLRKFSRPLVVEGIRKVIDARRRELLEGVTSDVRVIGAHVEQTLDNWLEPHIRRVINATGVMIHTNLGRAPLLRDCLERMTNICAGYSNLEMDLATGKRGQRMDLVREILCETTGAEGALVVNNNAAAVYLILRSLASDRQVLVSRGELVEIGGSFRIPDVMSASGAILVEVGTTNRTRLDDYQKAISPDTALVLKVHKSNFAVVGFTEDTGVSQLASMAHEHSLPLVVDMGSATLLERPPGPLENYRPSHVLEQGADLVCFSGDKLLGGPQAGIVLGDKDLVQRLAKDPMARALRVDKLTLTALECCLSEYRAGDRSAEKIPVVRMLRAQEHELKKKADELSSLLTAADCGLTVQVVPSLAQVGGGSLPLEKWPSFAVAVKLPSGHVQELARRLRVGKPAVLGRVQHDNLLLDVRTIGDEHELEELARAVVSVSCSMEGTQIL